MRFSSTGCPCEKKQSFMEDNFECNQHCTHSITKIHIKKWRKYKSDMELYFITRMNDGHTLWSIITKICWSGRLILYFQSALQQSQRYIISAYHHMKNLQPSSLWPRLAQNLRLETWKKHYPIKPSPVLWHHPCAFSWSAPSNNAPSISLSLSSLPRPPLLWLQEDSYGE